MAVNKKQQLGTGLAGVRQHEGRWLKQHSKAPAKYLKR
jgi:hypothetical protein